MTFWSSRRLPLTLQDRVRHSTSRFRRRTASRPSTRAPSAISKFPSPQPLVIYRINAASARITYVLSYTPPSSLLAKKISSMIRNRKTPMTRDHCTPRLSAWFRRATGRQDDIKAGSFSSRAPISETSPPYKIAFAAMPIQQAQTRAVTVFCGSSSGNQPAFAKAARCKWCGGATCSSHLLRSWLACSTRKGVGGSQAAAGVWRRVEGHHG